MAQEVSVYVRQGIEITKPKAQWVADSAFLDELIYGDLSLIDDLDDYLAVLDRRLGLPLAGSRGCWHDCGYCGGSRSAFRAHAGREKVAARRPARLVDDIALAHGFGARTFLVSQPAKRCEEVVQEIRRRYGTKTDFTLHLEPWEIPSRQLLADYGDICREFEAVGQPRTPQLLLSVHGAESIDTRRIERENIIAATRTMIAISDVVQVTIFDGYFCQWQQDERALEDALTFVFRCRQEFAGKLVSIALMAYSTDPESLWSRDSGAFHSLLGLAEISRGLLRTNTAADNLLLSRPVGLSPMSAALFMATLDVSERLYNWLPMLWFASLSSRGEKGFLDLLRSVARSLYTFERGYAVPTLPNSGFDFTILTAIENKLHDEAVEHLNGSAYFVAELASLLRAAAQARLLRATFVRVQSTDDLLVFDSRSVHESGSSFDRLFLLWRQNMRIDSHDIHPQEAETGTYMYTLLPTISEALPTEELDHLLQFDGVAPTSAVINALASSLKAPEAAVKSRVSDLKAAGTLRAV